MAYCSVARAGEPSAIAPASEAASAKADFEFIDSILSRVEKARFPATSGAPPFEQLVNPSNQRAKVDEVTIRDNKLIFNCEALGKPLFPRLPRISNQGSPFT
jgi:hypothetical protein